MVLRNGTMTANWTKRIELVNAFVVVKSEVKSNYFISFNNFAKIRQVRFYAVLLLPRTGLTCCALFWLLLVIVIASSPENKLIQKTIKVGKVFEQILVTSFSWETSFWSFCLMSWSNLFLIHENVGDVECSWFHFDQLHRKALSSSPFHTHTHFHAHFCATHSTLTHALVRHFLALLSFFFSLSLTHSLSYRARSLSFFLSNNQADTKFPQWSKNKLGRLVKAIKIH